MGAIRNCAVLRKVAWRLGRKIYAYARGDGRNDPKSNGEYWLIERLLALSSEPVLLFDVGANKGDWAAHALKISESKDLRIVAFEPSKETRSFLASRFASSGQVIVMPYALSDVPGEAAFYSDGTLAGTNSLSPVSGRNVEAVTLTTLDKFCSDAGEELVSMIKIDTEGFDLLVLRGAERLLGEGRVEVVQFEYNWRWLVNHGSLRDVFQLIAGKPYRFGKLVGESIELFDHWHFELDRYFENNYVLLRLDSDLVTLGVRICFDKANAPARDTKGCMNS